jgi:cation transport protein ChaC
MSNDRDSRQFPCRPIHPTYVQRERLSLPEREDFWVFGYGSLMWHPGFPHKEVRVATLRGYHRDFCVYSFRYRGTPRVPGLVLGLDRGGSCRGMAFRVPWQEGEAVLDYLYERELVTGVYVPRWLQVETDGGRVVAAGFVVDRDHEQYAGKLSPEEIADLIIQGAGQRGLCTDYLANTVRHLENLGLPDPRLGRLLKLVEERCEAD